VSNSRLRKNPRRQVRRLISLEAALGVGGEGLRRCSWGEVQVGQKVLGGRLEWVSPKLRFLYFMHGRRTAECYALDVGKKIRWVGKIIGGFLTLAGASTISDDFVRWWGLLGAISPDTWRWILAFVGLLIILVSSLPDLRKWLKQDKGEPQAAVELPSSALQKPTTGDRLGWRFRHMYWPGSGLGGPPGVLLSARNDGTDLRTNAWCQVRVGDDHYEQDFGSVFVPAHQRVPRPDFQLMFPRDSAGAPEGPLADDEYRVAWFGQAGVGREPLGEDCFLVRNGRPLNCDGTQLPETLPFGENEDVPQERQSRTWANMGGNSAVGFQYRRMVLTLGNIGDRWERGVVCRVTDPDGIETSATQDDLRKVGRLYMQRRSLMYPDDFQGAAPIKDGTYTIGWYGAAADDPEEISRGSVDVRLVVLSHPHGRDTRPGDVLALSSAKAKGLVAGGTARYLVDS
jgi:hypothetical protein